MKEFTLYRAGCSLKTGMNVLIVSTPNENKKYSNDYHVLVGNINEPLVEIKILDSVQFYRDGGTVKTNTNLGQLHIPAAMGKNEQDILNGKVVGNINEPMRAVKALGPLETYRDGGTLKIDTILGQLHIPTIMGKNEQDVLNGKVVGSFGSVAIRPWTRTEIEQAEVNYVDRNLVVTVKKLTIADDLENIPVFR